MIKNSSFSIAVTGVPSSGLSTVKSLIEQNQVKKPLFEISLIPAGFMLNPELPEFGDAYQHLVVGEMNYGTPVQGIVLCLDARILADQLFLVSQVLDLRKPVLLAVSYEKEAKALGITVKLEQLKTLLDCPVISVHRDDNGQKLIELLEEMMAASRKKEYTHWRPSIVLAKAYNNLDGKWLSEYSTLRSGERLLEGLRLIANEDAHKKYHDHENYSSLLATILESRNMITSKGDDYSRTEALQRAVWAGKIFELCVEMDSPIEQETPNKILSFLGSVSEKTLYSILYVSGAAVILLLLLLYLIN